MHDCYNIATDCILLHCRSLDTLLSLSDMLFAFSLFCIFQLSMFFRALTILTFTCSLLYIVQLEATRQAQRPGRKTRQLQLYTIIGPFYTAIYKNHTPDAVPVKVFLAVICHSASWGKYKLSSLIHLHGATMMVSVRNLPWLASIPGDLAALTDKYTDDLQKKWTTSLLLRQLIRGWHFRPSNDATQHDPKRVFPSLRLQMEIALPFLFAISTMMVFCLRSRIAPVDLAGWRVVVFSLYRGRLVRNMSYCEISRHSGRYLS